MSETNWKELDDLINAQLERELCVEDAERLAVWLSIDEEAQAYYADALRLHASLTLELFDEDLLSPVKSSDAPSPCHLSLSAGKREPPPRYLAKAHINDKQGLAEATQRQSTALRRWFPGLTGILAVSCLAMMLSVVAVFGSELLISAVFSTRRASTADSSSGMIVAHGSQREGAVVQKANAKKGTRRIGSSGHSQGALASVFLFPLPPKQQMERIESVQLEWTYKRKDRDPCFDVDLYGLGFVEPVSLRKIGFWEGPVDKSSRHAYGMAGSAERSVMLINRGVMKPETPCGRISIESRQLVRFIQSLYDDGAKEGDFAVFRLNADESTVGIARETGYAVVHPPSIEELTSDDELPVLNITTTSGPRSEERVFAKAGTASHSFSEHWSGGVVRSYNNVVQSGPNHDGTRRIGSSVVQGVGLVNVLAFSLPSVDELEGLASARLRWTLASKDNSPDFSVDLYGLGYLHGESYRGPCFWEGEHDLLCPSDYGLQGDPGHVFLISRRVMMPTTPCGPVTIENAALVDFLLSLYANGAQEGDLAVFRLNADISTLDITRGTGYSVIHAPVTQGRTDDFDLPSLSLNIIGEWSSSDMLPVSSKQE